eukprot:1159565-Pelagomonas_calceolata.AAC.2
MLCLAGTDGQAEQSNYLAKSQNPCQTLCYGFKIWFPASLHTSKVLLAHDLLLCVLVPPLGHAPTVAHANNHHTITHCLVSCPILWAGRKASGQAEPNGKWPSGQGREVSGQAEPNGVAQMREQCTSSTEGKSDTTAHGDVQQMYRTARLLQHSWGGLFGGIKELCGRSICSQMARRDGRSFNSVGCSQRSQAE